LRSNNAVGQRHSAKCMSARSKYPAWPSRSVHRFPIDGGLLLLDRASNCLFAYNDTARHVWDLLEEGRTEETLISEFAHAWGIPVSLARADVNAIVAEWRMRNVLVDRGRGRSRPASVKQRSVGATWRKVPEAWWSEWICTIRGTPIAFAVETELLGPFRLLFAHLETPAAVPRARMEIRTGPTGERVLVEDGRETMRTADPAEVIGALFVTVLELTRPNLQWFALIHGAALGVGGKGIALAGPSGSGKSTLAAGLVSQGYDFLADDLIALSEPDGTIVPWPLPLSIKQGSIDVVSAHHPQLAEAASYRTKGFEARMLIPSASAWDADPVPLRRLVFPRFSDGAAPNARRLSSFETIERLLTDRVWLGNPVTEQRMSAFLAWLDRTPAFALSYGNLADGIRLIADVVA
jgi:HPr Serine kinase C-terminal domain/Coenzyme PQQ synthesis protein D (PqqD)